MKNYCMKLRFPAHNGYILWLLFGLLLLSQPSFAILPQNIKQTNITNAQFTISWVTDVPGTGAIQYGTDTNNLNLLVSDTLSGDTHYIVVEGGLTANTTYYYDIISGGVTDNNNGNHYSIKTGPSIFRTGDDFVYGSVYMTDGTTTVPGAIVYLRICNLDGSGSSGTSSEWSTVVDNTGTWSLNLINVRTNDLSDFFNYSSSGDQLYIEVQAGSLGTGRLNVNTANDSPCQDIMVSTNTTQSGTVTNGSISVTSIPSEAEIYLDGNDTAQMTDHIFTNISPGTHSIKLILSDYENWEGIIDVTADQTAYVQATLTAIEETGTNTQKKIRQTNITGAAFTISWITAVPGTGAIQYGKGTNSTNYSLISDTLSGDTHYISVDGLSANTTYYYDIISGGVTDNNDGRHYSIKTGPSSFRTGNDLVYGSVYITDGTTTVPGAIVYLRICDLDGTGSLGTSSEWSTVVDDNGGWNIDLINVRTSNSSNFFNYSSSGDQLCIEVQAGSLGTGRLNADTANDSPCQNIMLSTDTTPPGTITNLSVGTTGITSVTLSWSSPGDNGYDDGTAAGYEIRYSTASITENNWSQASIASGVIPPPAPAGTTQQATVQNLVIGTGYCFAIKSYDEVSNWSAMSNTAAAYTYGTPTFLTISEGNSQKATVTTTLTPFTVKLTDSSDNSVGNYSVTWQIIEPGCGAALAVTSTTTNVNGITSTIFTLGTKTGTYTVIAAAYGLIATFTATAIPSVATNICMISGNGQQGTVNTTLTEPFTIKVTDTYGNPIAGQSINWTIPDSPAITQLSATLSTTNANGIATTNLTLGTKSGTYRVIAISGVMQATFTTIAIPGQIKQLAFVSPTAGSLTVGMAGSITIQTQDEFGNINCPASNTTIVVSGNNQSRFAHASFGDTWTETGTFTLFNETNNLTFFFKQNGTTTQVIIIAIMPNISATHTIVIKLLDSSSSGVVVADDGKTKVEIGTGAITGAGGYIEIDTSGSSTADIVIAANEKDEADKKIDRIEGTLRKFEIHGATITTTATATVRISIHYPDMDNDGFVDGTRIREDRLGIYTTVGTGTNAMWQPIEDSWVDYENNIVYALVPHFSYYILMGSGFEPTLEKAIAYPNPYCADKHTYIYFDRLSENSYIKIFNIAGELVQEWKVNSPQEGWNACNSEGEKVASGIYLYLITDPVGNKKIGKLAVVR